MKAKAIQISVIENTDSNADLLSLYLKAKPRFCSNGEALKAFETELKELAAFQGKTTKLAVAEADSGEWNERNKKILRLSRLIAALR